MEKIALITGASRGIGKSLAEELLNRNYKVIGTSRNQESQVDGITMVQLDLSSLDSIKTAKQAIISQYPKIDLLINNAGIGPDLGQSKPDENSFDTTFSVNLKGVVFFTEAMLDHLKDDGKLINISSKMGSVKLCEQSGSPAYRMSKSALNMYTKILANRYSGKLKVASMHPGWVQTTISASNVNASLTPKESARRIVEFVLNDFENGIYWDVESNVELEW